MSLYRPTNKVLDALKTTLMGIDPNISGTIETAVTGAITAVSQANPAVATSVGHGRYTGDYVEVSGVVGMTQLNGNGYDIRVLDDDTFELVDTDSTGFDAYSSGGAWELKVKPAVAAYASPNDVSPVYRLDFSKLPAWYVFQDLGSDNSQSEDYRQRSVGTIDRHFGLELLLFLTDGNLDTEEDIAKKERLKEPWAYATVRHLAANRTLGFSDTLVGPMDLQSNSFASPVFGKILFGSKDYWGMYINLAAMQRMVMEFKK